MSSGTAIVWFRLDLRIEDHPALHSAVTRRMRLVPVFIWSPGDEETWRPGAASRWWLYQSLQAMDQRLQGLGSRLILRSGSALRELMSLAEETNARAVFWTHRYEPWWVAQDSVIDRELKAHGFETARFNAGLLREPHEVKNKSGKPFRVFGAYWRACLNSPVPQESLPSPERLLAPQHWPRSLRLEQLQLDPDLKRMAGFRTVWKPGSQGGQQTLNAFVTDRFKDYTDRRNRPDLEGTSQLSAHLHFGEVSPRQVWNTVRLRAEAQGTSPREWQSHQFVTELGWREFAYHLLAHFPKTIQAPLRPEFEKMEWRSDPPLLKAWQTGATGFPMIDAGMRQLWATGWMHNRVRMLVASFLVKNLMQHWREGARWFWDTLVDADLANNTLGWQWTAGCGADAAPFFRIFNPVTQGQKFDPDGAYIRKWVPELAALPNKWIHSPGMAPAKVLDRSNIRIGSDYPVAITGLFSSRQAALDAYARLRPNAGGK